MESNYKENFFPTNNFNNEKPEQSKNSIHSAKFKFIKYDYSNTYYVIKKDKKIPLPSIEEIIKNATKYSKINMHSCFIQNLLEKENEDGVADVKNKIFNSIKEDIFDLSMDFYGNYVIQGILHLNDKEKNKIIFQKFIEKEIVKLCFNAYGSRVIQKLIESCINVDDIKKISDEIKKKDKFNDLFIDENGNHVIQLIIKKLDEEKLNDIYDAILNGIKYIKNKNKIITNKYGSRVIEALLMKLENKEKRINMIDAIFEDDIIELCKNEYSNYVINIILCNNKEYTDKVFQSVKGHIYELSKDEYALYSLQIIEQLIENGNEDVKKQICEEIFENDNKDNNYIAYLIKNRCGNYLIRKIIEHCSEEIIKEIINRIKKNNKENKGYLIYIIQKLKDRGFDIND